MINSIREKVVKSNGFKIIVWGLILTLAGVFTIPAFLKDISTNSWIVKVNGVGIEGRDFERRTNFWKEQLAAFKQQYGKYADMLLQSMGMSIDPSALALDSVIKDELLNQDAERLHIYINDAYVAEKLADGMFVRQVLSDLIPAYVIDPVNGINEPLLNAYLRQINLPVGEFEEKVKKALHRYFLTELMMAAVYVPSFETRERYLSEKIGKKYSILAFNFSDYLKKEKNKAISGQDLEDFFQRQTKTVKRYWVPEKRIGATWKFSPTDYGIVVTEQEIVDYYDTHKVSKFVEKPLQIEVRTIVFAVPDKENEESVRQQANMVRAELLENPDSFANKAKEISSDKESAQKGGLIPVFSKGVHESTFERAAFLLKNDGDISTVLRTKKGFEIVQRVKKNPTIYKSLESVKKEITGAVLKQKFSQKFVKDLEKLIEDPASIEQFIVSKKAKMETHPALEKNSSKLAAELFELKENEYGMYVDGDSGIVAKLINIQKRHLPALDSIKDIVEADLRDERAEKAVQKDLEAAHSEVSKKPFKELQSEFGAQLQETSFINRSDAQSLKALKDQGIPVEELFQVEKVGMVAQYSSNNNGYLVRLDEISPIDETDFQGQISRIKSELSRERKDVWGQGFVASLYRNATINLNENRFNQQ